ncbi:MAG TPA: hypothetical protein VHF86_06190, partial [Xanthomonadaceae bacterium]|nr:hypothetical protein [Xanthomonadaceae bacterium]
SALAATLLLVFAVHTPALRAAEPAVSTNGYWNAMPERELDALRGGFQLPSGLVLSFGIERMAYVNGQLVATQRYDSASGGAPGALLVQVGQGNRIDGAPAGGVVIQNTLDNQNIQIGTRIDATVGTLGLFQSINVQDTLQNALKGATGP